MKKFWMILPVMILAIGLVLAGCGDNENEKPENGEKTEHGTYLVPASADGNVFYLDLNDYQSPGTNSINAVVPAGVLTENDLTVIMTENDQRVNFKLTEEQVDKLMAALSVTVEITGIATPDSNFRYHFGDISAGSNWNGTASFDAAAFSVIGTRTLSFVGNRSESLLGFLILQHREATTTSVKIESIKITVVIPNPNAGCPGKEEGEKCDGLWMLDCECFPCTCEMQGEALLNLNAYDGITLSGSPSMRLLDGAIFFYNRPNDYSCIDLSLTEIDEFSASWEVGIEKDKNYRLTITGKAPVGATAQITRGASPWTVHTEVDVTGEPGETGDYVTTIDKTGAELLEAVVRIRVAGEDPFLIKSIVLEVLNNGDPSGDFVIKYETFDLPEEE